MRKAQFTESELSSIENRITSEEKAWLDTMAKEELGFVRERFVYPLKVALRSMENNFHGEEQADFRD
jgi:hypothetical protein